MSTKSKTTIGALPYQPVLPGEEIPEQNIAAEQALENMMAALERRKQKPFFDPTLLGMAAGFLSPTKTGGFGESLGYAAQNLAAGMDAERQREAEDLAFETGVLGQAAAIEQMKRRDKEFARLLGDVGEDKAPSGVEEIIVRGRTTEGQGIPGTEVYTPPGMNPTMGIPLMQPNKSFRGQYEYLRNAHREGKLNPSEALKEAQELERKRYEVRENGVVDLATGLIFPTPKGDLVERQIRDPETGVTEVYKIPSGMAMKLDHLQFMGKQDEYDNLARKALGKREDRQAAARETKAGDVAKPAAQTQIAKNLQQGLKSERQKEIERKAQAAEAEAIAKGRGEKEVERENKIITAGDEAGASRRLAQQFLAFANRPDAEQIFGFAVRPETKYQIIRLLTSGVGFPGASIGIPDLMESVRALELDADQMVAYQTFAQLTTELSLRMSEAVKGSVSNYEQGLFQKAVVNVEDMPGTIRMKANMLDARAKFDSRVANLYAERPAGQSVTQFRQSPEYRNAVKKYEDELTLIVDGKPRSRASGLSADQFKAEAARRGGKQ